MSFDHQMDLLIQKYLDEVKNETLTIVEIERRPRWKRVYFWWKALEYYENKPFPDLSLEEIKRIYGN